MDMSLTGTREWVMNVGASLRKFLSGSSDLGVICIGDYLAKAAPIVRALACTPLRIPSCNGRLAARQGPDEFYQTPLASSMERIHT